MREKIRKFLASHRRNALVRKIGTNLGYYWRAYENDDYDARSNGEQFVVSCVAKTYAKPTVFDVGAHNGEWAQMAAPLLEHGKVFSFEPVPETYRRLVEATAKYRNVAINNVGLGREPGSLTFSVAEGHDELTSGVPGVHGKMHQFKFRDVSCPVITGETFCRENHIDHVHLLKVDTEGMEPQIIRGFESMCAQGQVSAVQFEYGQINLQVRFFLGDFYELFSKYDMLVGKIYPNYVDFKDYHFTQDMLLGPNFLAVRRSETALINLLKGN